MKKTTICKDCKTPFDQNDIMNWTKCEHCRDRDQSYKERAIRESIGGDSDE